MPRRLILLFCVVVLTLLSDGVVDAGEGTLVTVNGDELTDGDLKFLFLSRRIPEESWPVVRDRYIEILIDRALLKQFLKSRKLTASRLLVDQHIARVEKLIRRENLDVDEVLKSLGYTRQTFREEVALPLTWKAHASLVITQQALEKYWQQQKSHFDGTEVHAAHIVRKVADDTSAAGIEVIRKSLADLRDAVVSGETSFAEAAAEYSDSPSKKNGGDLGRFPFSGRMPLELTRVAFGLKVGEISAPFQTQFGIHILTVTAITSGELTLEDARPELFDALSEQLRQKLLLQLRKNATIERIQQTDDCVTDNR